MTGERFNEIRKRKYAEDRVVYTVFAGDKKATALNIVNDDEWFMAIALLNEVYETKEEAEWYCKMNKSRIEKFEPPMLQDIKDKYIYTFVNGLTEYTFSVIKNKKHYCIGVIEYSLFDGSHNHLIDIEKATKEDYEKACEMVGKLFEGGKE